MNLNDIAARLRELVAAIETGAPSQPVGAGPLLIPGPDGVVTLPEYGIRLLVDEPLAADWRPSTLFRTLYTSATRIGREPSNAPFDGSLPKRSPAGYPLVYSKDSTGKRVAPGRVAFGDQTFKDDAELAVWRKAVDASTETLKGYGHKFSPL
jgi:hypothetical protein